MTDDTQIVQPRRPYKIFEDGNQTSVTTQVRNIRRIRKYLGISSLLILIGIFSSIAAVGSSPDYYPNVNTTANSILWIILACLIYFWWRGRKKVEVKVVFDDQGVVFDGAKYLYEHIDRFGFGEEHSGTVSVGNATLTYLAVESAIGTAVWIKHDNRKINLIDGLSADDAERIFDKISQRHFGQ